MRPTGRRGIGQCDLCCNRQAHSRAAAEQAHRVRLRSMGKMTRYVLVILLIAGPALAQDPGLAAWSKIHEVFSHPRCANCHVGPDNMPIWSGSSYGTQCAGARHEHQRWAKPDRRRAYLVQRLSHPAQLAGATWPSWCQRMAACAGHNAMVWQVERRDLRANHGPRTQRRPHCRCGG